MKKQKKPALEFRTLVVSDVHLGTAECRAEAVNDVLKHTRCEKLILNGDIIDGWALRRSGQWTPEHTRFVRLALKKLEKQGTEIVYTSGNHDEMLRSFLPLSLHQLRIVEDHIHVSASGGRYLVVHGDVFDVVTRHYRFVAMLGSVGYAALIKLNRAYNRYRAWRGKQPFSLSRWIKATVKGAVSYVGRYEEQLQQLAASRGCDGIICGHIHTPADKQVGEIHYLNSGDWVESLTCLVEHFDGRFEILNYREFRERLQKVRESSTVSGQQPYRLVQ